MEVQDAQGSAESPSSTTVADGILAHINRLNSPTPAPAPEAGQPGQAQPETGVQPGEPLPEPIPQEDPKSRYEERIGQLTREREEAQRQAEAFQLFIASNPQARAAYEAALMGGQPQPNPQGQPFHQTEPVAPVQLPEYDAFEQDSVKQHALSWFEEAATPHLQELQQMKQVVNQLVEYVQGVQTREVQSHQQQVISSIDEMVFAEIPSAKDNDVHFGLVDYCIRQELLKVPQNERNPQKLQEVTRTAVNRAKQMIQQTGGSGQQPAMQTLQGTPVKTFTEGGTNMVSPTPKVETVQEGIAAHLRAKGIF